MLSSELYESVSDIIIFNIELTTLYPKSIWFVK